MIEVKSGVFFTEEALRKSREAYAKPKQKSLWPAFQRELRKYKGELHLNDILRMYGEYQKKHSQD